MTEEATTAPPSEPRQSVRILTLISFGHALSNFYVLCLPALIPFLKADFAVPYALLGVMLTTRAVASGGMQLPVGIVVDRIGGKRVLSCGLVLMSAAFGGLALVPGFWWTLPLMALFGLGIATIRPSNYAILNASMPPAWIGRSFGINMFAGHSGRVIAPPLMVTAATLWGWRAAVTIAGAIGIAASLALVTQWRNVRDDATRLRPTQKQGFASEIRALASVSVLFFFLFYMLNALVSHGIHSFTVAALAQLRDMPLTVASAALTGYLIASAVGVLAGGFLVDKTTRHKLVATAALLGSAGLLVTLGSVSLPVAAIVAVMSVVGLLQGNVRPARDMLVRAVIPVQLFGKAIGMVATGASIGGALAPILFGWILDVGEARWLYYVLGLCLVLMTLTVLAPKERIAEPGGGGGPDTTVRS